MCTAKELQNSHMRQAIKCLTVGDALVGSKPSTHEEYIVEPLIKDPPRRGQPPNKGRCSGTLSHSISTSLTSERGQGTKQLVPKCPLFRGSTVQICTFMGIVNINRLT